MFVLFAIVGTGCASYTDDTKTIRAEVFGNRYKEALEKLDKSSLATQKRNRVLYLMERGTVEYLNQEYVRAAADWRKASEASEQLYTVSLSSTAASLAVNDSFADYEGENHEKVLLPIFSALAFLAAGDPRSARIEARRTDELMTALENAGNNKPSYARDSFAHLLTGLIYESLSEWDSAIIEYKRGLDNLTSSNSRKDRNVDVSHFVEPLCRLAKLRGRQALLTELRAKARPGSRCPQTEDWQKMAEVIVFYENGRAPIKVARDIVLPVQGQIVRVSYPSYDRVSYSSRGASVSIDNKTSGRTTVVQDIGDLARKALEERRLKDIVKLTARVIAKDQAARATGRALGPLAGLAASVVGAITETADTRSWTTLPDEIQVLRAWVPVQRRERKVTVQVVPDNGKPINREAVLKPGEKIFLRLRSFY